MKKEPSAKIFYFNIELNKVYFVKCINFSNVKTTEYYVI